MVVVRFISLELKQFKDFPNKNLNLYFSINFTEILATKIISASQRGFPDKKKIVDFLLVNVIIRKTRN